MSEARTPALLIVDDEPPVLALIAQLFPGEFPVLTARSGEEALALLVNGAYDLALLDENYSNTESGEAALTGTEVTAM